MLGYLDSDILKATVAALDEYGYSGELMVSQEREFIAEHMIPRICSVRIITGLELVFCPFMKITVLHPRHSHVQFKDEVSRKYSWGLVLSLKTDGMKAMS